MITLKFVRSDDIEIHRAGPYPWVRVANGVLQAGPHGAELRSTEEAFGALKVEALHAASSKASTEMCSCLRVKKRCHVT